jgi:hypothetical protein
VTRTIPTPTARHRRGRADRGCVDPQRVRGLSTPATAPRARPGAVIAFTDDDCRVPPNWVDSIIAAFAPIRRVAGVRRRRVAPRSGAGYAPSSSHPSAASCSTCCRRPHPVGVGANMIIHRRSSSGSALRREAGCGAPSSRRRDRLTIRIVARVQGGNRRRCRASLGVRVGARQNRLMRAMAGLGATLGARRGTREGQAVMHGSPSGGAAVATHGGQLHRVRLWAR